MYFIFFLYFINARIFVLINSIKNNANVKLLSNVISAFSVFFKDYVTLNDGTAVFLPQAETFRCYFRVPRFVSFRR